MSFTSVLGTSNCQLGNIELGTGVGGGSGGSFSENVSIDGVSAVTVAVNNIYTVSQSIDGISALTTPGGIKYTVSQSIDGISAITNLEGFRYQLTLTIAAVDAITSLDGFRYQLTLTIDAIDAATTSNLQSYQNSTSLDAVAAIANTSEIAILKSVTVSGSSAISAIGGYLYFQNLPIDLVAAISLLAGSGYNETLSLDVTAAADQDGVSIKLLNLSIDGVASTDESVIGTYNISQAIAGVATIDRVGGVDYYDTETIACQAAIYVEGLYNLLLLAAYDALAITPNKQTEGDENPSSVGSVSLACTGVFNRTVTHALNLTEDIQKKKPTEIIQGLVGLADSATVLRIRIRSASNTLSMTQDAIGFRSVEQNITFTDSVDHVRVIQKSVSHTLALTQTVSRAVVAQRSLTDTLTYNPPNLIRTQVNGFEYYLPPAYVALVPRKCMVILSAPSRSIVLPCPDFGDTENLQSSLALKRSMTGDTFTYVRRTKVQKIKYPFTLWTHKFIELRQFFIDFNDKILTLNNWKGETWFVYFSNNPIEFTANSRFQPKGEKYNVTLEFEGVKIC